mmetsp:Transcript_47841/g.113903  ORF Transcript_47841/g.113903 Transcript_47841/m.113903 type:complete len:246 (+) Transcript_47841:1892-2629(+)
METVSSTDGASTSTCWNLRSRAGSFSMYLRYSSSVVAPMHRSSPRASIGFRRLPASIAPSVLPAPMRVWISSRKRTIPESAAFTSLITAFRRSSKSPRNLAPATSAPRSSENTLRPWRLAGTSLATMRWASPSATAVLPTPASPSSTGLFLVRRERIWIVRRISSSRPITGSSRPALASSVRSRPYLLSASYVASGVRDVTRCPLRISSTACSMAASEIENFSSTPLDRTRGALTHAISMCSTEI